MQLLHRRLVDRFEAAIAGIPPIQVGSTTIARRNTKGAARATWPCAGRFGNGRGKIAICGMDTFTREDAAYALHPTGRVCPSVASYIGQHIGDLMRDFQAGRFAAAFPPSGRA